MRKTMCVCVCVYVSVFSLFTCFTVLRTYYAWKDLIGSDLSLELSCAHRVSPVQGTLSYDELPVCATAATTIQVILFKQKNNKKVLTLDEYDVLEVDRESAILLHWLEIASFQMSLVLINAAIKALTTWHEAPPLPSKKKKKKKSQILFVGCWFEDTDQTSNTVYLDLNSSLILKSIIAQPPPPPRSFVLNVCVEAD